MTKSNMATIREIGSTTLYHYIRQHKEWSKQAFGEYNYLEGLLKHIEKKVNEVRVEAAAGNRSAVLEELVDIIILTIDTAWREDFLPDEIVAALLDKQNISRLKTYPKITSPDEPNEHIEEE